jgi:hypothetical protein
VASKSHCRRGLAWTKPEDHCLPRLEDLPLGSDGWLDLMIPTTSGVRVTTTVIERVEEGHSTCRFPVLVHLSVPDLLSFLCHSTIGTSVRSCAPRCSRQRVD